MRQECTPRAQDPGDDAQPCKNRRSMVCLCHNRPTCACVLARPCTAQHPMHPQRCPEQWRISGVQAEDQALYASQAKAAELVAGLRHARIGRPTCRILKRVMWSEVVSVASNLQRAVASATSCITSAWPLADSPARQATSAWLDMHVCTCSC